jgi:hypothetical protein
MLPGALDGICLLVLKLLRVLSHPSRRAVTVLRWQPELFGKFRASTNGMAARTNRAFVVRQPEGVRAGCHGIRHHGRVTKIRYLLASVSPQTGSATEYGGGRVDAEGACH